MEDLVTSTGIHMTTEEFLEVDAEEPVFLEMTTEETVQLMRNDLAATNSESKDVPIAGGKVTST
jgi:hypothetical protein